MRLLVVRLFTIRCCLATTTTLLFRPYGQSGAAAAAPSIFRIVKHEPGQSTSSIPIFTATEKYAATLLDADDKEYEECHEGNQQCTSSGSSRNNNIHMETYRDGVLVLRDVLSPAECQRILRTSETMGYTEDAPVSLGRNIRQNESCVWLMNDEVNLRIFERIQHLLPWIDIENVWSSKHEALFSSKLDFTISGNNTSSSNSSTNTSRPPLGLNHRWRFYKYNPSDIFKMHTDGAWTDSGVDQNNGNYEQDLYDGKALSFMTFLVYLNDDFDGGETLIKGQGNHVGDAKEDVFAIRPIQGSVLCFYHGNHPMSPLHEGARVQRGTKYVARTDVLYSTSNLKSCSRDEERGEVEKI